MLVPNVLRSLILARPKSTSFATPSSNIMLSGLRSRCAYLKIGFTKLGRANATFFGDFVFVARQLF
jgi:hypothetical protein